MPRTRVDLPALNAADARIEQLRRQLVELDAQLGEACRAYVAAGGSWYDLGERFGRGWNTVFYAYSGRPVPASVKLAEARTVPVLVARIPTQAGPAAPAPLRRTRVARSARPV